MKSPVKTAAGTCLNAGCISLEMFHIPSRVAWSLESRSYYSLLPTWLLSVWARDNDRGALNAILARVRTTGITATEARELIQEGLRMQSAPNPDESSEAWVELVSECSGRGLLSAQDRSLFVRLLAIPHLIVRKRNVAGEAVPIELSLRVRSPRSVVFYATVQSSSLRINGKELPHSRLRDATNIRGFESVVAYSMLLSAKDVRSGSNTVENVVEVAVFDIQPDVPNLATPVYRASFSLVGEFVVTTEIGTQVSSRKRLGMAPLIKAAMSVHVITDRLDATGPEHPVTVDIVFKSPLPCDLAMTAEFDAENTPYPIGSFVLSRQERLPRTLRFHHVMVPKVAYDSMILRLKSDAALAKRSASITDAYEGDVRIRLNDRGWMAEE